MQKEARSQDSDRFYLKNSRHIQKFAATDVRLILLLSLLYEMLKTIIHKPV